MSHPIKVLHLTSSRFYGGPERQMLGLAKASRPKVDSHFASFSETGLCASFLDIASTAGFNAIELKNDTPNLLSAKRELSTRIKQWSIEVLVCHGYKASLVGWHAAKSSRIPAIAVSRGWTRENWKIRLYEAIDRWMLRKMQRVICVSNAQEARVRRAGVDSGKTQVIHNSISKARFATENQEKRKELLDLFHQAGTNQIDFIVGAAGRLSPEKGFDLLIDAASRICEDFGNVGFLIFGDGVLRAELQSRIDKRNVNANFKLAGFTEHLDLLMPNFDLFVQSSHTEGLPNVLLESLMAGVPIVATNVGGTSEVLANGQYGKLVNKGSIEELYQAISLAISSGTSSIDETSRGQNWVKNNFSFTKQAELYYQVFQNILTKLC